MKKYLFNLALFAIALGVLISCGSDNDSNNEPQPTASQLETQYFTVADASYESGTMPSNSNGQDISGVTYNDRALSGGMNFLNIVSSNRFDEFYLGVHNIAGYWKYIPSQTGAYNRSTGLYTYTIPVNYSTNLTTDHNLELVGMLNGGELSRKWTALIKYVESIEGDLTINLVFDNDKDIDLHLYMPGEDPENELSGEHIYYNHRGGSYSRTDGTEGEYGLDHDSNPACSIDGLNNENIVIPADKLLAGTYVVKVDMYQNCDRSIATKWAIIARYKGNLIRVTDGSNPANGIYPVNAGDGDHTTVMKFTLTAQQLRAAATGVSIVPGSLHLYEPASFKADKSQPVTSK